MTKMFVLSRLSLLFTIFFSFAFVFSNYTSSQSKSEVEEQIVQKETPEQAIVDTTPHNLVGSFYTIDYGTDAKLLLNNKGNTQLEVRPTLYNKQGQELQLPPVMVEPQSFRFINLADWAAIGGESYRSGNIKLFHTGKDLVLGSQIYLTQEAYSLSFEEKLAELGKFDSRRQEAVWVMPTQQTKVEVVLTNTTNAPLSVTAKLAKNPDTVGNPQTFQLTAHETKILDLRQDFVNGNQFANSAIVGLSLEHTAVNDALLARVMVGDLAKGYSNVVQFSNPAGGKSSEYQGVGFQIEDVAGQHLAPVIVARNVGTSTATITARVPYTRIDGTRGTISLPQKQLSAGALGLINTQSIVTRVQQEQIKVASLEVEYNTAPGSVIVATHSVSTDGNQVFRVPMWDPFGQRSPTGGYPWRIEGTSVTETYIKNITDVEEDYVAFLLWENGGQYMIGLKSIAAHETVHIDVKKLRDEQIPDEKGRTIPLFVSTGQLQWTLHRKDNLPDDDSRANLALIGRSEQVDITKGIVNNYSCQNCCSGTHQNGFIIPSSQEIEYGETAQFIAVEVEETCYGFPYEFNIGANWSSSNSGLGTISGGYITGQGVGQSNIGASWTTHFAFVNPCPPGGGNSPLFAFQNETAENCADNKNKRGGPNVSENEGNPTNLNLLSPPCGSCILRAFTFAPAAATLLVKPKVIINVPATAKDGDTVAFNVIVQGGTPTSYLWSFEAPSGAGNNPQVNFTASTSATTEAKAHWFANPDSPCPSNPPPSDTNHPYYNSKYKIKVKVTFQDGSEKTKDADFKVNAFWDPPGRTAPADFGGVPALKYDSRRRLYYVSGSGSLARTTYSKVIYVSTTSQFRNKTERHEEKHEEQWMTGLLKDIRTVSGFMNVISNFTDTTSDGLNQQIAQAFMTWDAQQAQLYRESLNASEIEAYQISDLLAPQYRAFL